MRSSLSLDHGDMSAKQSLRKQIRSKLLSLSTEEIRNQSNKVWMKLFDLDDYKQSKSVGLFLNMPKGEINTYDACIRVMQDGKKLYVPRVGLQFEHHEMDLIRVNQTPDYMMKPFYDDWPKNKWNIPEPPMVYTEENDHSIRAQPGDIDLLIVPGLGFDQYGGRLGQGKGYYDRFIAKIRTDRRPLLVGVGLEPSFLAANRIPMLEHDYHMDIVITPSELIFC
jgi:5-formyltetrahydrofolate cyclo-ligase